MTDSIGRAPRTVRFALVLAILGGVAAFALLAVSYDGWIGENDEHVAGWIARDLPSGLEALARPFSWLGGWIGLTAVGIAASLLLIRERSWLDLGFLLTALLGSQLVVSFLKDGFDRARPDAGAAVPLPESGAFPSGHAAAGVAALGAVAVLAAERLPAGRARAWLWAGAGALGIAVGLSRIALNVHFVSDVLAGWCLGFAWLAACLLLRDLLGDALRRRGNLAAEPRGRVTRSRSSA